MPSLPGFFAKSGSPTLKVRIRGIYPDAEKEFDAVIDTGFTGFVSMPLVDAFPLGLVLSSTTTIVLADNSKAVRLTAFGKVSIEAGDESWGTIILEWDKGDVLVGMDFLRVLKKTLVVSPVSDVVTLQPDAPRVPSPVALPAIRPAATEEAPGVTKSEPEKETES